MKIFLNKNVLEASLERINYLFDEFENVTVNFSGGKDSSIILDLCLKVAKERNRLPLEVLFIDQEAEWPQTIEYIRHIMKLEGVLPKWLQVPIQLFNSASFLEDWLYCWEEGKEWLRDKEDISIKENVFGTMSFDEMFGKFAEYYYGDKKHCFIAGVRAEESPLRSMAVTNDLTYKDITWGARRDKKGTKFTFYPIYDWSYTDVWHHIAINNLEYNKVYDFQYQKGVTIQNMRVSNLHHQTAISSLFSLQEIDGEFYNKLVNRMPGISTASQMGLASFFPKELPYMFSSWVEYRDFLVERLIEKEEWRETLKRHFRRFDSKIKQDQGFLESIARRCIAIIIVRDIKWTKISQIERSIDLYLREKRNER
jgi:predicted phosphoadenosine phosphosulfate sulfurtransferase